MPQVSAPVDRAAIPRDEVGPRSYAAALWRGKFTIAGFLLGALALGVAAILLWPVRYQASASILLDPRLGKSVGADPATPGFVTDASAIDSQVKLLTSQPVLGRVAKVLRLEGDPEFMGPRWSLARLIGPAAPEQAGVDLKTLESAITIKRPERTYLVEIQASASTADKAAAIANAVAEAYNEDQISSRVVSARNESRFVAQKREELRRRIEDAERRMEAYKTQNRIVSTDGLRSNEQQVADLTRELGAARGRLSDLKARAEQIGAVAQSGRLDAVSDALKSPTIERLRGAQADAEREVAKLSETLGARHPARQEAQAQAGRIRDLIAAETRRLRQAADTDYQVEKRSEAQLVAELDRIKKQSNDVSAKQVPLRQMEREIEALRQSDERFARIGDTLAQQEADTPPARVVASARPPVSPAWPKRTLILGVAGAAGLFFGFGAALMRDGRARRPSRPSLTEATADAPAPARSYWGDEPVPSAALTPPRTRTPLGDSMRRVRAEASEPARSSSKNTDRRDGAEDPAPPSQDDPPRRGSKRLVWS